MKFHKSKYNQLNKKNMEEQECVKDVQFLNQTEPTTVDNVTNVFLKWTITVPGLPIALDLTTTNTF